MPTTYLTDRQQAILDYIHRVIDERGYPPSLRETARHFNLAGTRGVEKHLQALVKKGRLRKGSGARALEAVGRSPGRPVPILGKVAAGRPILAEENRLGTMILDASLARWEDVFLLRIQGESMKEAGILDGDLVLVKPQPDAESGEIVVAMLEGEATVKRLIKKKEQIVLKPENPRFDPIVVERQDQPFQILGKVVGMMRVQL
jgi:repressor LexA